MNGSRDSFSAFFSGSKERKKISNKLIAETLSCTHTSITISNQPKKTNKKCQYEFTN